MSLRNLKHIACIFDFDEESRLALSVAGTMALQSSAELHIIHMVNHHVAGYCFMLAGLPTYHTTSSYYAYEELDSTIYRVAVNCVIPHDVSLITHLLDGPKVQRVVDVLRECRVDLCIIGLKDKIEWWKRIFSPSVIHRIIRKAPCPILVINSYSTRGECYAATNSYNI